MSLSFHVSWPLVAKPRPLYMPNPFGIPRRSKSSEHFGSNATQLGSSTRRAGRCCRGLNVYRHPSCTARVVARVKYVASATGHSEILQLLAEARSQLFGVVM